MPAQRSGPQPYAFAVAVAVAVAFPSAHKRAHARERACRNVRVHVDVLEPIATSGIDLRLLKRLSVVVVRDLGVWGYLPEKRAKAKQRGGSGGATVEYRRQCSACARSVWACLSRHKCPCFGDSQHCMSAGRSRALPFFSYDFSAWLAHNCTLRQDQPEAVYT
eukprot:6185814-Pleurochrysis_carterae.AAC.5